MMMRTPAKTRIPLLLETIEAEDDGAAETALHDLQTCFHAEKLDWEGLLSLSLPAELRVRLVKILGMTGSRELGEARAAIARARAIAAKQGIAWAKLFDHAAGFESASGFESATGFKNSTGGFAAGASPFADFTEAPRPPPPPRREPPPPPKPEPPPKPAPAAKAPPPPEAETRMGSGFWTVQQCNSSYEGIWYTVITTTDAARAAKIYRERCGTAHHGGGVRLRDPKGKIAQEWRPR